MNGPGRRLRVTYVRRNEELDAIEELPAVVSHPERTPWQVRLADPDGHGDDVEWEVALIESGSRPVLFDSSETAKVWATEKIERLRWWFVDPPPAEGSEEADESTRQEIDEATEHYRQWAQDEHLDPASPETVRRAHAESVIASLCLYKEPGCKAPDHKIVSKTVGNVPGEVGWKPRSYTAPETTAMFYEVTNGWQPANEGEGKSTAVHGWTCRGVPHDVGSLLVKS